MLFIYPLLYSGYSITPAKVNWLPWFVM